MYNFTNEEFSSYVEAIYFQTSDKIQELTCQKDANFLIPLMLCIGIVGDISEFPLFRHLSKESCAKFKDFLDGKHGETARKEWLRKIIFEKLATQQQVKELAQYLMKFDPNAEDCLYSIKQVKEINPQVSYYRIVIIAALYMIENKSESKELMACFRKALEFAQELNPPANLILAESFAEALVAAQGYHFHSHYEGLKLFRQITSLKVAKLEDKNKDLQNELSEARNALSQIAKIAMENKSTPSRAERILEFNRQSETSEALELIKRMPPGFPTREQELVYYLIQLAEKGEALKAIDKLTAHQMQPQHEHCASYTTASNSSAVPTPVARP